MKTKLPTYVLLCFVFVTLICNAQQPDGLFKEWGGVTTEELKMTECSFQKNADAMLLLNLGQIYYQRTSQGYFATGRFRITTSYYQRYKIFSERGTSNANKKITLRISNNEDLVNIKATCYNIVGGEVKKTELQESDIHTVKLSASLNQVTFTVPAVTAGSVFEVGYGREQDVSYGLPDWFFSSTVPTAKSSITVGFLDAMIYYVHKHILADSLEEKKTDFISNIMVKAYDEPIEAPLTGKAKTYTTYRLAGYQDEPYVNARKNYMSWMGFQIAKFQRPFNPNFKVISSFDKFAEHLYDDEVFSSAIQTDPVTEKQWVTLIKPGMSQEEKARIVYDYIRSNMSYNEASGGFTPSAGNVKLWKNKTGSQTDINMILICAMHTMGIPAYPMLVSRRRDGEINTHYPMLSDYTGIDALIILDGKGVVLDAAERELPFGEPGYDQLNTEGWVMQDRNTNFWYDIKEKKTSMETVLINAALDEGGTITGTMDIVNTNHKADYLIGLKKAGHQSELNEYLKNKIPNVTVESVTDTVQQDKCYFTQRIKFSVQATTDNEGNVYLSVPGIYGSSNNPFVNKERIADVDLGYTDRVIVNMKVAIPATYTIDSVFKPLLLNMSDTSVTFVDQAEANEGTVIWLQKLDHHKSFYKQESYPAVFEFEKKYFDIRQRPVVLRKKS